MDDRRRKNRDLLQNLLITLLTVSAVFLFSRTQLFQLGVNAGGGALGLLSQTASAEKGSAGETAGYAAPVRLAVTADYWRYGSVTLTTEDEAFGPLGALLGEALASAGPQTACMEREYLSALEGVSSIYCDFLHPLPFSVLAGLTGADCALPGSARYLTLSMEKDAVRLYCRDGSAYTVCTTSVAPAALAAALEREYTMGSAVFAWDSELPHSTEVQPYSLFTEPLPRLPVLTAAFPAADTDVLLTALQVNPRTNSRYFEASGTEVVVEGDRSVRVSPGGMLVYQGGEASPVTLKADGKTVSFEMVKTAASLLRTLVTGGAASFYLENVEQTGEETVLRWGYQTAGVPIRFSDGGSAAEMTVVGGRVTLLTARLRTYSATETVSALLPLEQALAIAAMTPGGELSVGYTDGGDAVSANWILD